MAYTPTNWQTGDVITAVKLNNMESGIADCDTAISDLKEELNLVEGVFDSTAFDWAKYFGSSNFVYGWRTGYYSAEDGSSTNNNLYYLRTRDKLSVYTVPNAINGNEIYCKITPPTGFGVRVSVYDSAGDYIGYIGDYTAINEAYLFKFDSTKRYAFTVGRFDNRDSDTYLNAQFINTIVLTIYSRTNKKYLPDTTGAYIWDSTLEYALKLPVSYHTAGNPVPLLIMCHGESSTINASTWGNSSMQTLVGKFVDSGFAVLDVNQVTTADWCNPALISKYVHAVRDVVSKYNVTVSLVYGMSMGDLIGLCLATLYSTVKACVISGLRLDFSARYTELSSDDKAIVDTNLGFTDGYNALIASGWDKTAFDCVDSDSNTINPVQFPPTFFVIGSTDTVTKTESLAKLNNIKRGGTITKDVEYTGDHNAVSYLTAGASYSDAVAWFNKWL